MDFYYLCKFFVAKIDINVLNMIRLYTFFGNDCLSWLL
jgi:hypothetical protein